MNGGGKKAAYEDELPPAGQHSITPLIKIKNKNNSRIKSKNQTFLQLFI